MQASHAPLGGWLEQLRASDPEREDFEPLAAGWRGLADMLGVPDYPMQARIRTDGASAWFTASPYGDLLELGVRLTRAWLNWTLAARQLGQLPVKAEQFRSWCGVFDSLAQAIPDSEVMQLHHRLWGKGVTWQWLGENRTRIGEGIRQVTVEGAPDIPQIDDPESLHIPIYTVTGSVGKTTTVRLLHQLLQSTGKCLALTASDGAWIGTDQITKGDAIGGAGAHALLQDPQIEAALFEQGRGGFLKQGMPYAHSDVGVMLNIQAVHLHVDGIETLEDMADLKALGLLPARVAVLNREDTQCRRIGDQRAPDSCVWFSVNAGSQDLRALSEQFLGAAGIQRGEMGEPQSLVIWRDGRPERHLSLDGVAPYHGLLGEKTLEELLAAVAAAWFGPLPIEDWDARLPALRLDSENHLFRTSIHRQGDVIFVLDKAAEDSSLSVLQDAIEEIARREGIGRRIVAMCRAAGEHPDRHYESARSLFRFMDEFVCFDRPDTYTTNWALPIYEPGSIPLLLRDELQRLNAEAGTNKPVTVLPDWAATEEFLRKRIAELGGKTLVLINQPSTGVYGLNESIVDFVAGQSAADER
ncbi:MAG: Mur ligase family protein [Novosphingobium sp.]|nr:hypothetical protein [Novosphingobium sp.]